MNYHFAGAQRIDRIRIDRKSSDSTSQRQYHENSSYQH